MRPTTFFVGSGRSGSTAVSHIMHAHPRILNANEMLASFFPDAFPDGDMSGEEYWAFLTRPSAFHNKMIRSGTPIPELVYLRRPTRRYSAEDPGGIPSILLMTLSWYDEDPDDLLDELEPTVRAWPTRPIAGHYRAFFELLADRYGRDLIVERSGYTVDPIPWLRESFTDATFVHQYRHGPDCAMSMSRHPGYRSGAVLQEIADMFGLANIVDITEEHVRELPPDLAWVFQEKYERAQLMDRDIPVAMFGRLWSECVIRTLDLTRGLGADRLTSLSYEDMLERPERELTRLAVFLGAEPEPAWLAASVASLDASRRGAAERLPADERRALYEACEPGREALRAAGLRAD